MFIGSRHLILFVSSANYFQIVSGNAVYASLALRWSNAKYEFWIGATDADEEGEWRWAASKRRLRDGFQVAIISGLGSF